MTEAEFVDLVLPICLGALILYMIFIMYRLAVESDAGRFGTFIIFLALGLGVLGFVIKEVLIRVLE